MIVLHQVHKCFQDSTNVYWKEDPLKKPNSEVGQRHDVYVEEGVLTRVEEYPQVRTRQLAADTGLSRWKVSKM